MASSLPLWYGRERGTSLASLVTFDDDAGASGGFLDQVGDRLFGGITDVQSGVVGFFVPFLALLMATAVAAHASPALSAMLALATLIWGASAAAAAWLVTSEGEAAPAWTSGLITILVTFGRLVIIAVIIATIVAVILALLSLVMGISASEQ